jgi:hypothetical protein
MLRGGGGGDHVMHSMRMGCRVLQIVRSYGIRLMHMLIKREDLHTRVRVHHACVCVLLMRWMQW